MFNTTPPPSTIFTPCKSGSEITCSLEQVVRSIADQSIRIPSQSHLGLRFSSTRLSNQQSKLVDRSLLNRSCYSPFCLCLSWYHLASCNLSFANSNWHFNILVQSWLSTVLLEIVAIAECWSSYAMLIFSPASPIWLYPSHYQQVFHTPTFAHFWCEIRSISRSLARMIVSFLISEIDIHAHVTFLCAFVGIDCQP